MMNITLNFPGENSMTLMEWRGIYRVLYCWRGGRFFPVLCVSHFSNAFAQSVAGETEEVCAISMVPSPLPNPNSLKQLTVHSTIFTCAPRGWYCTFGQFSTFHRYHRCALAMLHLNVFFFLLMHVRCPYYGLQPHVTKKAESYIYNTEVFACFKKGSMGQPSVTQDAFATNDL